MSTPPGVTVVIPTWNRATEVSGAVDSVLAQDWPSLEILLVDDGSTDRTVQVLSEYVGRYGDRVRLVRQAHQGVSAARNRGIREAQHDLVAFLDSDDRWIAGKLRRQVSALDHDPSLSIVFTSYWRVDGQKRKVVSNEDWDPQGEPSVERLLMGCCLFTSTALARRNRLGEVGLFDTKLMCCEDHDLWLRMAAGGHRLGYIPEPLAELHTRAGSLSSDPAMTARAYERVIPRLFASGQLPARIQSRRKRYLAHWQLTSAERYLAGGDGRRAARSLRRAVLLNPLSIRPGWLRLFVRALRLLATSHSPRLTSSSSIL